jgi:hypothetical protein
MKFEMHCGQQHTVKGVNRTGARKRKNLLGTYLDPDLELTGVVAIAVHKGEPTVIII